MRTRVGLPLAVVLGCGGGTVSADGSGGTGLATGGGEDSATSGPADGEDASSSSVSTATSDDTGGDETGGEGELCDGFDNDGDGDVDEICACSLGEVQDCYAGPPEDAIACRGTTQECRETSSEQPATWGRCDGLCDGSTLSLDDPTALRVLGAAQGDRFTLASRAGFGDVNGDGELDFIGGSSHGDGVDPDVGAGYLLYGGPCLQGAVVDLATFALAGDVDENLRGGFVVDDVASSDAHIPNALLTDVDGDGFADAVALDSGSSAGIVHGAAAMSGLYDLATADGATMARLTGGGGTGSNQGRGHEAVDFDADGLADVFMAVQNFGQPTCPCGSQGVDTWWGREQYAADTPLDTTIPIGIGTVGTSTQHNFSRIGGSGDFDNDGFLDLSAGNGAANDGYVIDYRAFAFFGNATRSLPSSMTSVAEGEGFMLAGGAGRGPFPNHQHGDFNGDGIDDFVAYPHLPYSEAPEVYLVFGGPTIAASLSAADLQAGVAATLTSAAVPLAGGPNMGVGDIDADGFDDVVIGVLDDDTGGVVIVWGRATDGGVIDLDADPEVTVIAGGVGLGRTEYVAVGDVDGDGLGDLVIGAPSADTANGSDSGAGIVKFGSCLAAEHNPDLRRGQDGDDALSGDAGRDTIVGGRGDDLLEGGGGADVLGGGHGDDRIVVGDLEFARVHGGLGRDTLVLDAAGMLDLRTVGRARVQEIERFELGAGAQTLALNPGDVTALSSSSNRIEIDGDAEDAVILEGDWTTGATVAGYVLYGRGTLLVAVAEAIPVTLQ